MTEEMKNAVPGLAGGITQSTDGLAKKALTFSGAPHAFEIEYALGNLHYNKVYAWTKEDQQVSDTMLNYFANFIKTGNPNGKSLPEWPALKTSGALKYINIDVNTKAETESNRGRYLFLDQEYSR